MRITFLTGSLEQGKDGVGDYTRLLAHECASRGAAAQVVALADRHTERPRTDSSGPVEVVRLPYGMRWPSTIGVCRSHDTPVVTALGQPAVRSLQLSALGHYHMRSSTPCRN